MKNNSPAFFNGLIKALITLTAVIILTACGPAAVEPQEPELPQPSATATVLPTPEPTPTSTPVVLEGRLFFDMNGSGLRDEASFQYDSARLADERQPLQADLLAALNTYLAEHPDIKDGDLVTLEEPGLSGYGVCAGDNCATTDQDGSFVLPRVTSTSNLKITDPNAGTPALEMRYINKWNKAVIVPAYEINGVQVPEQHLNDTEIKEIDTSLQLRAYEDLDNNIGLMQGYLTWIFQSQEVDVISKKYGLDIDVREGYARNYLGETIVNYGPNQDSGTGDGHIGWDWGSSDLNVIGTYVVASAPGFVNFSGSLSTWHGLTNHITLDHPYSNQKTGYGHLDSLLVSQGKEIYRGQIVGTMGMSGTTWPHVHYNFHPKWNRTTGEAFDGDPFRNLEDKESFSWWTIDNLLICPY